MAEVKTTLVWKGDEIKIRGKRVISDSSFEIGLAVEGQAKQLSPINTGRLAGSITTQSIDKGTSPSCKGALESDVIQKPRAEGETYVGTPVFYAPYIEYGTRRTNAQAFLRPALSLAEGKTLTIVKKNAKWHFAEYLK